MFNLRKNKNNSLGESHKTWSNWTDDWQFDVWRENYNKLQVIQRCVFYYNYGVDN